MGWPSEVVFITAPGLSFAEVAHRVAKVLGYPAPDVPAGAVDVTLPAGDGRPGPPGWSTRPPAGLLVSSDGPGTYCLSLSAPTVQAAVRAAYRAYAALSFATGWELTIEAPEDGTPPRHRPGG